MNPKNYSLKSIFLIFIGLAITPIVFFIFAVATTIFEVNSTILLISYGFFILIILTDLVLIVPFRYLLREKMMKNLADKFSLNFKTDSPRFFEIIFPFALFKYWGSGVNNVDGTLNDCSVHIHDVPFAKSIFQFIGRGSPHYTFIDIKDKNGNLIYKNSKVPLMFKSIYSLKRMLEKIRNT